MFGKYSVEDEKILLQFGLTKKWTFGNCDEPKWFLRSFSSPQEMLTFSSVIFVLIT